MTAAIRSTSLPLGALVEVLGHADAGGGQRTLARSSLDALVDSLRAIISTDPTGVATLRVALTALDQRLTDSLQTEVTLRNDAIQAAYGGLLAVATDLQGVVDGVENGLAAEKDARNAAIAAAYGGLLAVATDLEKVVRGLQNAVSAEVDARNAAIEAAYNGLVLVTNDLYRALAQEDAERSEADIALDEAVRETQIFSLVSALSPGHPGECPSAFAASALGRIQDSVALDPTGSVATSLGRAYRIEGAGIIAPRAATPLDPDGIWVVQARYWRLVDVLDPNNNAIDLGIQWLDAGSDNLGTSLLLREPNLRVQDGPKILTARVPSLVDDRPVIQPPKGAVFWRPFLRTYGADGVTVIQRLSTTDATFTGVYAPDLSALAARVGTMEGQVELGVLNALSRVFLTLPGEPTPQDIAPGTIRDVKDASTGRISTWANDGGRMVNLLDFFPAS